MRDFGAGDADTGLQGCIEEMLKTDTRQANWCRSNPGKYDAHLAVQRALKAGELENHV